MEKGAEIHSNVKFSVNLITPYFRCQCEWESSSKSSKFKFDYFSIL